MLQRDEPEDFVIATDTSHSVREFIELTVRALGMEIIWQGQDIDEVEILVNSTTDGVCASNFSSKVIIRIDPRYFRPTEVETLLGDVTKAKETLDWQRETSFEDLVLEMSKVGYELALKEIAETSS